MPTYEYKCENCGYKFEKFQGMSDKPIESCPSCKGNVKRLIGKGIGVIFKGSGFHSTDYKGDNAIGRTCCGREEPCDKPPCADDGECKR